MESVSYKVVNMQGQEVGTVDLDAAVFSAPVNQSLVHQVVRWQRAKKRAGTHQALTRSMMKGGGKKPWRQKGTGRARAGSGISPVWVGGAVVHGPQPRDYTFRLPKRTRRQALAAVLSEKVSQQKLVIVDELAVPSGKTRDFASSLKSWGVDGKKALLVVDPAAETTRRSSANIADLRTLAVEGLNVYDVLNSDVMIVSRNDIAAIEARVNKREVEEA